MMEASEEAAPVEAEWMVLNETKQTTSTDTENDASNSSREQANEQEQTEGEKQTQQETGEATDNGESSRKSIRFAPRRESGVAFVPGTEKIADTGAVEEKPPEQYQVIGANEASGIQEETNAAADSSSSTAEQNSSSTNQENRTAELEAAAAAAATSGSSSIVATLPEEVRHEAPILENLNESAVDPPKVEENNSQSSANVSTNADTNTSSNSETTTNTDGNTFTSSASAADATTTTATAAAVDSTPPKETIEPRKESAAASSNRSSIVGNRYVEPKAAVCTVEGRTQSGEIFTISDVKWTTTIKELKGLIYVKFKKFEVKEMRLLKGGKTLDDDNATIESLGFKNKENVYVIRKLNASSDDTTATLQTPAPAIQQQQQQQQQQQSSPQGDLVTVQCPLGHGPGSRLRIRPEGREPMLVTVPPGVAPGGYFRVMLPPLNGANSQTQTQQQQQQQTHQHSQQSAAAPPRPKVMAVTCPGLRPGDMMEVIVPGVGRMRVPIPRGVSPGQDFRFRLPD